MMPDRELLTGHDLEQCLTGIHEGWQLNTQQSAITRLVKLTGFDEALTLVNHCATLAAKLNHHPDIRFGWGYCEFTYTSHDVGGLTQRDIRSAAALDDIIARRNQ